MIGTIEEKTWTTHSGRIIPIKEMQNEHLLNAISMVDKGFDRNGDPVRSHQKERYNDLVFEAQKRGLKIREDGWDA